MVPDTNKKLHPNAEPRIFILHGWAVDPHNEDKWHEFRNALKQEQLESTFIPLPGLTTPLTEVWDLDDYVSYVAEKLPQDGSTNIVLGHSFGGQIAVRLAATRPSLVAGLVLLDPAGLRANNVLTRLKRTVFYYVAKVGKRLTTAPQLRKLLYTLAREKDYYQADKNLAQTMANVVNDEITGDLKKIAVPVLLIWGQRDTVTPVSLAKRFTALLPNAELDIIADARHAPQFSHYQLVATKVTEFIRKVT